MITSFIAMFNKYDYRQYDTSYGYTFFQYIIGTTVYHNDTLKTFKDSSTNSMTGWHWHENLEITDKIGMTYWAFGTGASSNSSNQVYTLKKYCGKDFTAITGVKKNVVNAPKTAKASLLKFYKVISYNNNNQGVTLLGRTGAWKNGTFGILIQRRNTN